jgi:hypothetical protein
MYVLPWQVNELERQALPLARPVRTAEQSEKFTALLKD